MRQIYLIGIGMGNPDTLTVGAQKIIARSDCLIGAKRMLQTVNHPTARQFSSFRNEEIAEYIAQQPESSTISVLLSGDTGFYSGAKKLAGLLKSRFPDDRLEQLAGISSLQYFCAKLQTGWDDVKLFSVHGRQEQVVPQVRRHPRVFVLTGSNQTAQDVCKQLCEQGLGDAQVWVGEQLSYPQERILSGTAEQLAEKMHAVLQQL